MPQGLQERSRPPLEERHLWPSRHAGGSCGGRRSPRVSLESPRRAPGRDVVAAPSPRTDSTAPIRSAAGHPSGVSEPHGSFLKLASGVCMVLRGFGGMKIAQIASPLQISSSVEQFFSEANDSLMHDAQNPLDWRSLCTTKDLAESSLALLAGKLPTRPAGRTWGGPGIGSLCA